MRATSARFTHLLLSHCCTTLRERLGRGDPCPRASVQGALAPRRHYFALSASPLVAGCLRMFTPAAPSAGGAGGSASGLWDVLRKEVRLVASCAVVRGPC